jgi:alkanesulfonate monooxygenase SsuD/methylene tetrahydromethanopterin reductase-like flavin-dependent oxidoreductase (luciferase family)
MATIGIARAMASSPEEWIRFCQAAERAGFEQVWGTDNPDRDCFMDATLALQATERIKVGTFAYPIRTPLQTAMVAAALARYRPGRFMLSVGHGGEDNLHNNGIPTDRPLQRLRDYLLAISTVIRSPKGTPAEFVGEYYQAKAQPYRGYGSGAYGLSPAELPIVIGAFGPQMNRLAARRADGMFYHSVTAWPLVRKRRADAERLRPAGSSPFIAVAAHAVAVHVDEGVALRRARAGLTSSLGVFRKPLGELAGQDLSDRFYALRDSGRLAEAGNLLPEEVVRAFVVVTTPSRMMADLRAIDDADQVLVEIQQVRYPETQEAFGFTAADDATGRAAFLEALFR